MRIPITFVFALGLGMAGCNSGGSETTPDFDFAYETLGDLWSAVQGASPSDADGDSLPDEIERQIGTEPLDRDTDRDGLSDNYELFGADAASGDPLPDRDRDGIIAPLDFDDDGDLLNDGEVTDTDGDGVPNYLEFYGYVYDSLTGRFLPWNGDPGVEHFRTDPLQRSTDQDAYSDGAEVSGALDPSVQGPGDDPLVPAYPNIVFELVGYTVTLNEEIQIGQSYSLERGATWGRETETTYQITDEQSWETSAEVGTDTKVGAKYGEKYASENSTAVKVSAGGSVTSSEGWSQARSTNPTKAAQLKLLVKVTNRGTAPISNLVPTLTLNIGGLSVATFQPGAAQVNILVPGGTYPAGPGVNWVIDRTALGEPLFLTMEELRALEEGAPISMVATQVRGEVTFLDDKGGWDRLGEANEYVARCNAVCAQIRVDLGDGQVIQHLVYASDGAGSEPVTLGETLGRLGVSEDGTLLYLDAQGIPRVRRLDDFTFVFDAQTLRDNGWKLKGDGNPETEAPADMPLMETNLSPTSDVLVRAPRDLSIAPEPVIHYAYLDPLSGDLRVSCADYQGIASVVVSRDPGEQEDQDDATSEVLLVEEIPDAGFYYGAVEPDSALAHAESLIVTVTNAAGTSVTRTLGRLWVADVPQKPIFLTATLGEDGTLYANVESGNPDNASSDIQWVRVYNAKDQYQELARTSRFYEDPDGYTAKLASGFELTDLEVVAYVTTGVYAVKEVDAPLALIVKQQGTVTLMPEVVDNTTSYFKTFTWKWFYPSLNLDNGYAPRPSLFGFLWLNKNNPGPPADFWARIDTPLLDDIAAVVPVKGHVFFNAPYTRLVGATLDDYRAYGKSDLMDAMDTQGSSTATLQIRPATWDPTIGTGPTIQAGDVFAIRTDAGCYAKVYVKSVTKQLLYLRPGKRYAIEFSYVTFK